MSTPTEDIDTLSTNTIRILAADVVQKANSGHPGMPMGMAPVAHVVWSKFLQLSAQDPKWINRDRFVLSNGHGCTLLYILLHLRGFKLSIDDLKSFRQWGSVTPGHPESRDTEGVEVTTGPLGQGIGNAVGMAMAQRHAAALYNRDGFELFTNYTFVFCGDGCLQEGVASEAASLAGHHGLGRIICIYDDNSITIDGDTSLSFNEDVPKRFEAYGWHTLTVERGDVDFGAMEAAIVEAKAVTDRPTLISVKTTIGFLSSKAGSHGVHGAPLGPDDIRNIKKSVGFDPDLSFNVVDEVRAYWESVSAASEAVHQQWLQLLERYAQQYPVEYKELKRTMAGELPTDWQSKLPVYTPTSPKEATRKLSGAVLNAVAETVPELIGGSADLTPSNNTALKCTTDFFPKTPHGRYFRFGIREHGMVAIANGISAYGLFIPFTATFLNFITYAFPAIRLAALSHLRQILIMTHDSIGLGEDGPTHQPVEVLSLLRATPNLLTFRPADGNEVAGAYVSAMEHDGPTVMALTRQGVPPLPNSSVEHTKKGAYIVQDTADAPELVLIATGSEVGLALDSAASISFRVRVVSAPCLELFKAQSVEYRRSVLPVGVPVISIEAQGPLGWSDFAHRSIAVPKWGASAPGPVLMEKYGFSVDAVTAFANNFITTTRKCSTQFPIGCLPCHYE